VGALRGKTEYMPDRIQMLLTKVLHGSIRNLVQLSTIVQSVPQILPVFFRNGMRRGGERFAVSKAYRELLGVAEGLGALLATIVIDAILERAVAIQIFI
jgi:hypothetical protein